MASATQRDIDQNDTVIQGEKERFNAKTPRKPQPVVSNRYPADYIHEAQLLLAYASQKGLKVDNEVVSVIVRSRHLLTEETWDSELEVQFWDAFNTIAQLVHPVSVASLKATYPEPQFVETEAHKHQFKFFRSKAEGTVFFYQIGSLFFLFVLLAIQTFWLMGSMRMTSVVELTTKMKTLQAETERQYTNKGVDTPEMDILHGKIEEVQARIQANYQMLSNWTWKSILQQFGFVAIPQQALDEQASKAISPNLMIQIDILLQEKKFVLQTIQTYILPLLYGLLGAYAYVLIQISKEIKLLTYVEPLKVSYRLRLQLGALSGLAVGWFINPDSSLTDSSSVFFELSPLTLAFVAGYSVDVLFALMDRLIFTFSSGENTKIHVANKKTSSTKTR